MSTCLLMEAILHYWARACWTGLYDGFAFSGVPRWRRHDGNADLSFSTVEAPSAAKPTTLSMPGGSVDVLVSSAWKTLIWRRRDVAALEGFSRGWENEVAPAGNMLITRTRAFHLGDFFPR